mgnify:CR=1 FL=1
MITIVKLYITRHVYSTATAVIMTIDAQRFSFVTGKYKEEMNVRLARWLISRDWNQCFLVLHKFDMIGWFTCGKSQWRTVYYHCCDHQLQIKQHEYGDGQWSSAFSTLIVFVAKAGSDCIIVAMFSKDTLYLSLGQITSVTSNRPMFGCSENDNGFFYHWIFVFIERVNSWNVT